MAGVGGHVQEHRVAKEVFASSIAGALADGIMYPMMTVKARLQVQGSGSQGSARTLYMYGGPLHAFQTIATKEGWRTFYKGASTILVGVPSTALYFSTYETIKRLFPGGQESSVVQFGGGIFASLGASIIDVPVEVIRQRQMVQTASEVSGWLKIVVVLDWRKKGFPSTINDLSSGSIHTAKSIYRLEGVRALYRGFLLNQMLCIPFNAIFMPLWEYSKRACAKFSGAESIDKLEIQYELGSSLLPSAFAAALTNPMDVIKTRLQVQGKSNVHNRTQYSGACDAAKEIYKNEGMAGFSRGVTPRMLWVAPSVMICFTTYDQLLKWLA